MLCGDRAYSKAERNGFDPSLEIQKKASEKNSRKGEASKDLSVKAADLFHRVPTLKALFYEVISFQSLSTILNTCFVGQLKRVVTNDAERAAFTGKVSKTCCRMAVVGLVSGCDIPCINLVAQAQTQTHHKTSISSSYGYVCSRINSLCYCARLTSTSTHTHKHTYIHTYAPCATQFYASINALSGIFQFILLPLFMKRIEPRLVWKLLPVIPASACVFAAFQADPSLALLATAFFSAKFMDYSLRGVVTEMVFVPLDFESRYLGKEVIGVFANRFGKSVVSVGLSAITYVYDSFSSPVILTKVSTVTALLWITNAWTLSGLIPKQDDAEEMVEERRKDIEEKNKKNRRKAKKDR